MPYIKEHMTNLSEYVNTGLELLEFKPFKIESISKFCHKSLQSEP